MRNTEVLESGKRADSRSHQIIGDKEKCTDDGDDFTAMPDTCINAAAVRVKTANDHVVQADQCSQHAHGSDEPERCVTGDCESEANDVGFARAPVTIKNRGRARHIDIARTPDVGWNQDYLIRKRGHLARRGRPTSARAGLDRGPCPLMMPTRLAVGLEPLNVLDAAHRAPRSLPLSRKRNWFPRYARTSRALLSRTKN